MLVSNTSDMRIQCQHLSQTLGIGVIIRTACDRFLLIKRSANVGECPNMIDCVGGHPEPSVRIASFALDWSFVPWTEAGRHDVLGCTSRHHWNQWIEPHNSSRIVFQCKGRGRVRIEFAKCCCWWANDDGHRTEHELARQASISIIPWVNMRWLVLHYNVGGYNSYDFIKLGRRVLKILWGRGWSVWDYTYIIIECWWNDEIGFCDLKRQRRSGRHGASGACHCRQLNRLYTMRYGTVCSWHIAKRAILHRDLVSLFPTWLS